MTGITIRWAGPSDAAIGSTYKIERTTDNAVWTELEAAQAATSPYVSPTSTLSGNTVYGAATVVLASGAAFSSSGYAWIDDAMIQWTGKSSNDLTGVTWHSGSGTYAIGTAVYEAHEAYADTVSITLYAVLYRITHLLGGVSSAPVYLWYFAPPAPLSSDHCVVVVHILTDLGVEAQSVECQAYLAADTEFGDRQGAHLDAGKSAAKSVTTNAFGMSFFQCWKSSRRSPVIGTDAVYTFVLNVAATGQLTVTATTIPDRDWVLLSQIATATS